MIRLNVYLKKDTKIDSININYEPILTLSFCKYNHKVPVLWCIRYTNMEIHHNYFAYSNLYYYIKIDIHHK